MVSSSGGGGVGWGVDMVGGTGFRAKPKRRIGIEVVRNRKWVKVWGRRRKGEEDGLWRSVRWE